MKKMNIYQLQNKLYTYFNLSTILKEKKLYKHTYKYFVESTRKNKIEYFKNNKIKNNDYTIMSNNIKRAIGEYISDYINFGIKQNINIMF